MRTGRSRQGLASRACVVQTLSAVKLSLKDGTLALGCGVPQIMSVLSNGPGFVGTQKTYPGLQCQNP